MTAPRRVARAAALAVALAVGASGSAGGQASPYVPLDDPAYAYVDALAARGLLAGLSGLERPYTVASLRRAVAASGARDGVVGGWLRALDGRAALHDPAPSRGGDDARPSLDALVGVRLGATAQTSGRRDLVLADDEAGVHPAAAARLALRTGRVVAGARIGADQRLRDDPEFAGVRDSRVAGRVDDAYVSGQWRFGELFVGRLSRNWGPPRHAGLQVGDDAYSYDHLLGRLGTEQLRLTTVLARLDDRPGLYDPVVQRYLAVHRLAGRWRDVEVAATETYLYSGANRGFEPSLANPLAPAIIAHYNEQERDGNLSLALDVAWRTAVGTLAAQAMVDDFQFEDGNEGDDEPSSYGLTVGAEGLPLWGDQRWFASYTRVSNLTYRTGNLGDAYIVHGLSLGRASSDYDEVRVGLDLAVLPALPLRAYVARRRQGEGDYRLPFPDPADNVDTPGFLAGRVARVTRVGVSGAGEPIAGAAVTADLGWNVTRGHDQAYAIAGPVPLAGSGFAGRVTVTLDAPALSRRFSLF